MGALTDDQQTKIPSRNSTGVNGVDLHTGDGDLGLVGQVQLLVGAANNVSLRAVDESSVVRRDAVVGGGTGQRAVGQGGDAVVRKGSADVGCGIAAVGRRRSWGISWAHLL